MAKEERKTRRELEGRLSAQEIYRCRVTIYLNNPTYYLGDSTNTNGAHTTMTEAELGLRIYFSGSRLAAAEAGIMFKKWRENHVAEQLAVTRSYNDGTHNRLSPEQHSLRELTERVGTGYTPPGLEKVSASRVNNQ